MLIFTSNSIFRERKFYGKSVIEGVQHHSETIYMPHNTNHAVYNLDQTVAVGDNPFFNTAIEESVFNLFRKGQNAYSYIKDVNVYLDKGTFKIHMPTNQCIKIFYIKLHITKLYYSYLLL